MYYSRILSQKDETDQGIDLLSKSYEVPEEMMVKFFVVTAEYIARPDLVALDIYGEEMYTDVICRLNGISNWWELNEGDVLIIPDFVELERFYTHPSQDWNQTRKIVTKLVTDKRKTNEATTLDSRFFIDDSSNTIIY